MSDAKFRLGDILTINVNDLVLHEVAATMPLWSIEDSARFAVSYAVNKQLNPISVTPDGKIWDGRNRWLWFIERGILMILCRIAEPKSPLEIIEINVVNRLLTDSQRIGLAAKHFLLTTEKERQLYKERVRVRNRAWRQARRRGERLPPLPRTSGTFALAKRISDSCRLCNVLDHRKKVSNEIYKCRNNPHRLDDLIAGLASPSSRDADCKRHPKSVVTQIVVTLSGPNGRRAKSITLNGDHIDAVFSEIVEMFGPFRRKRFRGIQQKNDRDAA